MTYFRLFLSTRLMYTMASFLASASRASAAAALASFFFESFSARFWASTERVAREAVIASVFHFRISRKHTTRPHHRQSRTVSILLSIVSSGSLLHSREKVRVAHLQSTASDAYLHDSAPAIPCISSPCRQTRNTKKALAHQPNSPLAGGVSSPKEKK